MADDIDNLLGIAEIAGVFVGFAALVTVIARGRESESRDEDVFVLASIVIFSVMVITAALLPVVLDHYGLAQSAIWRISGGFLYVVNLLMMLFLNRSTLGFAAVHSRRRVLSLTVWSLSPFFHIPLLLCIFGAMQHLALAFFLTAIVAVLFQVSLLFAYLVISMMVPVRR